MKSLLVILVSFVSISSFSQSFRLNGYAGYAGGGDVEGNYAAGGSYSGTINGGFQWGAGAEYILETSTGIELIYMNQRSSSTMKLPGLFGITPEGYNVSVGWLMLKGSQYFGAKETKFQGFAGLGLGLCMTKAKADLNGGKGSDNSFAWQLHGGGIYWPSRTIGIKLTAQYQMAVTGTGGAFVLPYNGIGNEVVSSYPLSQFGAGIGLVIVMDNISGKSKSK